MARNFDLSIGEYYHLYNRGTEKRAIFLSDADRARFLGLLYLCNNITPVHISNYQGSTLMDWLALPLTETIVDIGAYCLMPNHFHLLVREKKEGGISLFIQKVSTAYTMYFNKKHSRTGALFSGRFKARHADNDIYLKYLFSYIHLNPVKIIEPKWRESGIHDIKRAECFLKEYRFSSYAEYCQQTRPESAIINRKEMPEYFKNKTDFKKTLRNWLAYKDEYQG